MPKNRRKKNWPKLTDKSDYLYLCPCQKESSHNGIPLIMELFNNLTTHIQSFMMRITAIYVQKRDEGKGGGGWDVVWKLSRRKYERSNKQRARKKKVEETKIKFER